MNTEGGHKNWSLTKSNTQEFTVALALLLLPLAAGAGGVVTNCTEADLRAAMEGGGMVTFACDCAIGLTNTNMISISLDTVLDGSGHQVTIGSSGRAFYVNPGVRFTAVNLNLGGSSGSGSAIYNAGGTVSLTGVTFDGSTATTKNPDEDPLLTWWGGGQGGAILNGGTVTATNCTFRNNAAWTPAWSAANGYDQPRGGAIINYGVLNLQSCTFVNNQASGGSPDAWMCVSGHSALGGAIYNSGTATLDLCTFMGNSATGGNGAGLSDSSYPGGGGGEGSGGAIFSDGPLTVNRSTFCGNVATGGSGGPGGFGAPSGGTWTDGYPGGDGGNAYGAAICGTARITCSTLVSNIAIAGDGGEGGPGGRDTHEDYGGIGGSGGKGGAGVGGFCGTGSLVNCTMVFDSGTAGVGGAGGDGPWAIVQGGSGGTGGNGGTGVGGATCPALTNSTVAWNGGQGGSGGTGGDAGDSPGWPGAPGTNGISGASWGGTSCGVLPNTLVASNTPAGGDTFADPKLGPLANNGGPTLTMALLPGSPAIDAGNTALAPTADQRGFPRPAGVASDIGAFEYGSVMPAIAISLSGTTGLNILGSGNAGQPCRLLWSPDLSSWVPLATNQIGGDGTVLFCDTCTPGTAPRFYRLVTP